MAPHPRPAEQGFVLITALWLLLLCGAVVALMMLRNSSRSIATRDEAQITQSELNRQAAMETVLADLLFRGPASRWASLPATGAISINGEDIAVDVSSENGRFDLNSGDPAFIDRGLQAVGVSPSQRATLIQTLTAMRLQNRSFSSMAQVEPLIDQLASTEGCPDDWFTLYSGLSQPDENQLSPLIASRLGIVRQQEFVQQTLKPGTPIRLRLRGSQGGSLLVVARIAGSGRAFDLLRWSENAACSQK